MTLSNSNCSRSGHKLAMASKSRSVRPRIAAKNSFFMFGQLFNSCFKLSPGDASSRKLLQIENLHEFLYLFSKRDSLIQLTTSQNRLPVVQCKSLPTQAIQSMTNFVISTYQSIGFVYCIAILLSQSHPCSLD